MRGLPPTSTQTAPPNVGYTPSQGVTIGVQPYPKPSQHPHTTIQGSQMYPPTNNASPVFTISNSRAPHSTSDYLPDRNMNSVSVPPPTTHSGYMGTEVPAPTTNHPLPTGYARTTYGAADVGTQPTNGQFGNSYPQDTSHQTEPSAPPVE